MERQQAAGIPKEELERQLAGLQPEALSLLAARSALRVLPLLGVSIWPQPARARNLLAVWVGMLAAWQGAAVTPAALAALEQARASAQGFIAGGEGSAFDGSVRRWEHMVALGEQCARLAAVASESGGITLCAEVLDTAADFLWLLADLPSAELHQQEIALLHASAPGALRKAPLLPGESPSQSLQQALYERFLPALKSLLGGEAQLDRALEHMLTFYPLLFDGKLAPQQAAESLEVLQHCFDSTPPVSAAPGAGARLKTGSATPAQAARFEAEQLAAAAEPLLDDTGLPLPEAPGTTADAKQAQADAAVQRELAYRPSDRQSIEQISEVDHLNRGKLVDALATILAAPGNGSHQTIGLLGDWGVGKSTVVHLLKNELIRRQHQQPFLFAEFNAWAYEHTDNLQAGIAQEMLKALTSDLPHPRSSAATAGSRWQKLQAKLGRCAGQINWLYQRTRINLQFAIALNGKKMLWLVLMLLVSVLPFTWGGLSVWLSGLFASSGSATGNALVSALGTSLWIGGFLYYFFTRLKPVLANPLAKELLTYLKLPDYGEHLGAIPVMRKNIETLCRVRLQSRHPKQPDKRLLFVVDDLDRCGHAGIVKVFEAVRLVLDLQRVTVIIAVDQRIALAALALHYKDLAEHHQLQNPRAIARDYLAKVIHLPIMLSPPDAPSIAAYLHHIWQEQSAEAPAELMAGPLADPAAPAAGGMAAPPAQSAAPADVVSNAVSNVVPLRPAPAPGAADSAAPDSAAAADTAGPAATPASAQPAAPAAAAESAPAAAPQPLIVPGLSALQKRAFEHWVGHFQLTNPRQLKRLHNSYNLLRHFYGEDQADTPPPALDATLQPLDFPLMVTLFALEYLNSLDNPPLRSLLRSRLRGRAEHPFQAEDANAQPVSRVDERVVQLVNRRLPGGTAHLVEAVEPFVLPAIEQAARRPLPANNASDNTNATM